MGTGGGVLGIAFLLLVVTAIKSVITEFTFIFLIIISMAMIFVGLDGLLFGIRDPEEAEFQL